MGFKPMNSWSQVSFQNHYPRAPSQSWDIPWGAVLANAKLILVPRFLVIGLSSHFTWAPPPLPFYSIIWSWKVVELVVQSRDQCSQMGYFVIFGHFQQWKFAPWHKFAKVSPTFCHIMVAKCWQPLWILPKMFDISPKWQNKSLNLVTMVVAQDYFDLTLIPRIR